MTILVWNDFIQHCSTSHDQIQIMNLVLRLEAPFTIHFAQSFRKKLPFDYKKGDKHDHRNTHSIPMEIKGRLMKDRKGGSWKKIRQLQRKSLTPFGKLTKKGFIFDKEKLPFYDIPNLEGFELKPYVEYNSPKISEELLDYQTQINQQKLARMGKSG